MEELETEYIQLLMKFAVREIKMEGEVGLRFACFYDSIWYIDRKD